MKTPYLVATALVLLFIGAFIWDQPVATEETPQKIVITYWEKWTGFEGEAMKAAVDLFNSKKIKNKKGQVIKVKYLTMSQVDRKSLLATAGGVPPDLAGLWMYNAPTWADMNGIMPLDSFIKRDHFDMDKFLPVFKGMTQHRDRTICFLTTPATLALHWNKEVLSEAGMDPNKPPRTLQEILEMNEKVTKFKDGKLNRMGFLPVEPGWFSWAWGYWWGGKLYTDEQHLTADDPKNIEAWKWITAFAKKYGPEDTLAFKSAFGSFDSPQNAFMSGQVAMVVQGVWMANFIRFNNPHMKWDCGEFPSAFDNEGQPVSVADADVIVIPRGCRHADEAWEFLKFIDSHEGMECVCKGQGKLTPFKENTPGWIESHPHPHLKTFIDMARSKNVTTPPRVPVCAEYQAELSAAFDAVWLQRKTPEEALKAVQERMQPKNEKALNLITRRLQKGNYDK